MKTNETKKFYINDLNDLNELEKKYNKISYRRIIEAYASNILLANNICETDESVYNNMEFNYYDEESDKYIDIYQWYLCDLNEWEKERLQYFGVLLSYSDSLDLDIICVEHFGTAWDAVLTDVEPTTNWEEFLNQF